MIKPLARREFLVMAAGAGVAGCTTRSGPACGRTGLGPGAGYCLVESQVLRVTGGATLAAGHCALVALDDNTAALLIRDAGGLYALSGICTHACCAVTLCTDAACATPASFPSACAPANTAPILTNGPAFLCPCHGSEFDANGGVMSGPAQNPLPAFAVTLEGADALIDCSTVVASSVRV